MSKSPNQQSTAHLALLTTAFLFGTSYVIVKSAVANVDPIPFLGARFTVGLLVLLPFAKRRPPRPGEWRGSAVAGLALLVGYATQTIGLQHITGSASAFITYLLVLFVPVLVALRTRTFPCLAVCGGIALALVGLWFLTGAQLGFGLGETLTVACAASFAVHMLAVEAVAGHCDAVRVNAIQVGVVAAGSLVPGFFLGGYNFPIATWLAVLYTGVATTAVGLSFQVWGQARLDATRASLVLLLEPVFAAVVGALIADRLGPLGIVGAALIMSGIIVAEYTRLPQAEHRLPELCEARAALADC